MIPGAVGGRRAGLAPGAEPFKAQDYASCGLVQLASSSIGVRAVVSHDGVLFCEEITTISRDFLYVREPAGATLHPEWTRRRYPPSHRGCDPTYIWRSFPGRTLGTQARNGADGGTPMRTMTLAVVCGAMLLLFVGGSPIAAQSTTFDTSGLPNPPTTFEEQQLWDEIQFARQHPELAARAHEKLAAYYERKGLTALAALERAAAGSPAPAASPQISSAPPQGPLAVTPPVPPTSDDIALDPQRFDLSGFPSRATDFEEQLVLDSLQDPNTLTNPVLLAFAHRQLGRYYAARGRVDLAGGEYGRAIIAYPEDHRSYQGLAALHEAVGTEATDGNVVLRDVADQLQVQGLSPEGPSEPEPEVARSQDPGQWREVSAEFNRRMNSLYTSNAWNGVYRTVFTNLYGR